MTGHRIDVLGQRFFAHHGCLPEEAIIGQEYLVDVKIWVDLSPSAESDDLNQTVDYVDVHQICAREMAIRSKLVEQVAGRILTALRVELPLTDAIEQIEVTIAKFAPPIGGDCERIAVTLQA
jgi:dihydroneopterin aldolase